MTGPYQQYPANQPAQPPYAMPGPPPDNHLVWGILTTILCCLPLGIVSIIKANEVNTLWAQGQYDAARETASAAGKWAMWSAIAAVAVWVLSVVFIFVMFAIGLWGATRGLDY